MRAPHQALDNESVSWSARMAANPAAQFIILCTREVDGLVPGALERAATSVTDWPALAQLAARHCVAAYVLQAIRREGLTVPAAAATALVEATRGMLGQVMALNVALRGVLAALAAAQVPAIVLKGPALARTLYGQPSLRPYGDLDLTVQDQHEAAAVAALLAQHYRELLDGPASERRADGHHHHAEAGFHRKFVHADGQTVVELHLDPLQLGVHPTCEAERWQRAVPVPGVPHALMLGPEDQLLQLSVHAHKHGFDRLIWLKDLDLLLRAHAAALDWDLVLRVARAEGVQASLWYTLELTTALLATPTASEPLRRLAPTPLLQALYRSVWPSARIAALQGEMHRRAVQFDAADSWRGMLPGLLLMGRRRARARALVGALLRW